MNIRIMSDLHVEFFDFEPVEVPADVVVLAGDILTEHHRCLHRGSGAMRRA